MSITRATGAGWIQNINSTNLSRAMGSGWLQFVSAGGEGITLVLQGISQGQSLSSPTLSEAASLSVSGIL